MAVIRRGGFPRRQEDPLIQQLLQRARQEYAQSSAIGSPQMYQAAAGGGIGPVAGVLTAQILAGARSKNALQAAQLKQEQANIADTKLTQALINREVDGKIVGPRGQFFEATQSADEPLTESNLASALKQDMSGVEGFVTPIDRSGEVTLDQIPEQERFLYTGTQDVFTPATVDIPGTPKADNFFAKAANFLTGKQNVKDIKAADLFELASASGRSPFEVYNYLQAEEQKQKPERIATNTYNIINDNGEIIDTGVPGFTQRNAEGNIVTLVNFGGGGFTDITKLKDDAGDSLKARKTDTSKKGGDINVTVGDSKSSSKFLESKATNLSKISTGENILKSGNAVNRLIQLEGFYNDADFDKKQGLGANFRNALVKAADLAGFEIDKKTLAFFDSIEGLTAEGIIPLAKALGVNPTDFDFKQIEKTFPRATNTPAANRYLIAVLLNRAKQADKLLRWETDSENQFVTVNGKRTFIYDNMKAYDIYTKNRQKILNEIQKEDDIFYNDPQNGINNILGL
jgi:hypothetical protein